MVARGSSTKGAFVYSQRAPDFLRRRALPPSGALRLRIRANSALTCAPPPGYAGGHPPRLSRGTVRVQGVFRGIETEGALR